MEAMIETLILLTVGIALTSGECPFGTLRYEPQDGGKVQCYVVMKYHEIRFITMMLWREGVNSTEWHRRIKKGWNKVTGIRWEMDTVDSYSDALRMCSLIGELDPEAIIPDPQQPWNADIIKNMILGSTGGTTVTPMIKMPNFPVEWTMIPGDDIHFRLPTPMSMHHLAWIRENIIFDGYYWMENQERLTKLGTNAYTEYRDRGLLWLGITRNSTSFEVTGEGFNPRKTLMAFRKKEGNCGLFYRSMSGWKTGNDKFDVSAEGGLYWVTCRDSALDNQYPHHEHTYDGRTRLWSKKGHAVPGYHIVACEFDEPEDCVQRLENQTCYISEKNTGNFSCVLAGKYEILRQPHKRFGKKCRDNETDGMTIPCPKRMHHFCRQDCRLSQWQNALGCLMPANEEDNNTFYACIDGDGEGVQFQVRRQVADARFGGADNCHTKRMQRKIGCTCGGQNISAFLWVVIVCVIAAYDEKMTALLECQ